MTPNVLFVISGDPRTSARPAEAIRIAVGVAAWKKVNVTIYLRNAAVRSLTECPDELVDEYNYVRYLPLLNDAGRPVYVQRGAPALAEVGRAPARFEEITDEQLAGLAAQSTYVLNF